MVGNRKISEWGIVFVFIIAVLVAGFYFYPTSVKPAANRENNGSSSIELVRPPFLDENN